MWNERDGDYFRFRFELVDINMKLTKLIYVLDFKLCNTLKRFKIYNDSYKNNTRASVLIN